MVVDIGKVVQRPLSLKPAIRITSAEWLLMALVARSNR
jgi:hypothetical protein